MICSHLYFTVAATACVSSPINQYSGYIVKFGSVQISLGISGISSFKSSRKFQCGIGGLYIVYVSLTAYNTRGNFEIYLNGNQYATVQENDNNALNQGGSTTVVVNFTSGDLLWVQLTGDTYVNSVYSCVTIVMIKWQLECDMHHTFEYLSVSVKYIQSLRKKRYL